jgi:putative transposase
MLQPLVRRTWCRRGKPCVLKAWDRHDRLTAVAAITLSRCQHKSTIHFSLQATNAKAEDRLMFLLKLHKELKTKLLVVWDRLGAHRRAERFFRICECPRISFEHLPAYSPELNPVEHIWTTVKWGRMANWPAPDIDRLRERLVAELTSEAKGRKQLQRHFLWAKLKTQTTFCSRRRQ